MTKQDVAEAMRLAHNYAQWSGLVGLAVGSDQMGVARELAFDKCLEAKKKLKDFLTNHDKSFGELYPANPDAKCKCEHWQACKECHPTYEVNK